MIRRLVASLRVRLVLVILLTCALALAFACVAVAVYEYSSLRSRLVARLGALANVVGDSSRAALGFRDKRSADATLAGLEADPTILAAALYDRDGSLFARFARRGEARGFPARPSADALDFSPQRVALFRPIAEDGERAGTVYLLADVSTFEQQLSDLLRASGAILVLALLFAALLAYRLQRLVSGPLLRLSDAARRVSEARDYGVRVPHAGEDEIGALTRSFNEMLEEIQRGDTALRESQQRYELAVRGAREGIWDWDLVAGEVHYSPRWKAMLGYGENELGDSPQEWLGRVHTDDASGLRQALDEHVAGRTPHFELEHRLRHRDGGWIWVQSRGLAVRNGTGRALRMAGSQWDVTVQRGRDQLTGLPNRLLFADRLERSIARAKQDPHDQFAVLCLELERLKAINDAIGRAAGRELLVAAAERIRSLLSPTDTLARLDGGAFAILIEELRGPGHAARTARAIHAALAPAFRVAEQEVFTTAAIGIALSASGYDKADDLLRDAHTALDRARVQGWNQSEVFDERMRAEVVARLDLETELRYAVERGELEVYFQPIVAVDGQRIAGMEALARWRKNGAEVPPAEFIGLAEETGIIVPLGSWVLREALRNLRAWRDERPAAADLVLSVNVSARQFAHLRWIEEVDDALRKAGVPPDRLKLELTESAFVDPQSGTGAVLRELQRMGVGLWLDDFGTGYSSLSYLQRLPLEVMKIDRSFVQAVNGGEQKGIVRSLVSLARDLGMKTVAEGVETAIQLERVAALRCDYVQGHHISLPLDAEAAAILLRTSESAAATLERDDRAQGADADQ